MKRKVQKIIDEAPLEENSPPRFFDSDVEADSKPNDLTAANSIVDLKTNSQHENANAAGKEYGDSGVSESWVLDFLSVTGEKTISEFLAQKIWKTSNGDLNVAVDMYFDESFNIKNSNPDSESQKDTDASLTQMDQLSNTVSVKDLSINRNTNKKALNAVSPSLNLSSNSSVQDVSIDKEEMMKKQSRNALTPLDFIMKKNELMKYIGCFGVEAYSTASGTRTLQAGERIYLERQKLSIKSQSRNSRKKSKLLSINSSCYSNIVRFCNSDHHEIGKLPTEVASVISTLMEQGFWSFEAICIYSDNIIRFGSNVTLQVYCFINVNHPSLNRSPFTLATNSMQEEEEHLKASFAQNKRDHLLRLFTWIALEPDLEDCNTKESIHIDDILKTSSLPEARDESNSDLTPSSTEDEEDVVSDQLAILYDKVKTSGAELPSAPKPSTFALDLREYQKQALYWMCCKEEGVQSDGSAPKLHPLWSRFRFPKDSEFPEFFKCSSDDDNTHFYVNLYTGETTMLFPNSMPYHRGGILADEMGLGKTIEVLSLIHSRPCFSTDEIPEAFRHSKPSLPVASRTTLVVAPMSLLDQWHSEACKVSQGTKFRSMIYYGSEKPLDLKSCVIDTSTAPLIIITSYGVLLSEFSQQSHSSGLFSVHWFRVVLDEGHNIRNRESKTAKACHSISSQNRWVITGTPIVNKLDDLYSLIKFMRYEPWCNYTYWQTFVSLPYQSKDVLKALNVVQSILEFLVLRRTKETKDRNGNSIVTLPPKTVKIEYLDFSDSERKIYDSLYTKAKSTVNANIVAGTLFRNYTTILGLLLRLRQACCDPVLLSNMTINSETFDDFEFSVEQFNSLINQFVVTGKPIPSDILKIDTLKSFEALITECPICCNEPIQNPLLLNCKHACCGDCLSEHIQYQKRRNIIPPLCHTCRQPFNEQDVYKPFFVKNNGTQSTLLVGEEVKWKYWNRLQSVKLNGLLGQLRQLTHSSEPEKVVIFSQFTTFLDIIADVLESEKMGYARFDGTMSQQMRSTALETFRNDPDVNVLIISLKAGGVGLNLTCANHVFIMDPWWSWSVEAQAIDRIHRLGQEKPVFVTRYIVRDTVEERMLKIQERKNFITGTLGMSEGKQQVQSIEDIKMLFEY
ncbi:ATP-dependent chromatin remodeller/ubiquitin-protein ligase E3 Rad8 [Schizosaccharomyces pombe]|uniref:DNA-dependent ATPase/E3 ubiquitin-protein ligase rad8 n=1 Tax=Schizosaccharomyces pombe (strain 972 / ATCC 24843) TaxID=284812 RepID=RAD5_SCHPO|nr:ubiquitin-protein ligase E3 Rad8 [Schizosaccharomyces pombe]P36607.1 RecName: Full=DNA repair protein rad8; AltName: Full=DNA repair protein RAD5 homolog [Schizosaccharomyces pombe 972h-]CAA52686.1 rad8 [Schizosaccharomyces pombe]CAA89964.2 ubiquitin-protein ligase E3 Rad8 [Schizosaccharomyces pombe]|eukprot:NP_001342793.1 ubiquitin-protein ligase E3 Rad8 [Schizosaccharomyces pombe]